jgi:hypothetical protein
VPDENPAKPTTERILDIAGVARSFIDHPYWLRVSRMLENAERAETEVLLDPTSTESQVLMSRASVANIRRLLSMPHRDIQQGELAIKAVESHAQRFAATKERSA